MIRLSAGPLMLWHVCSVNVTQGKKVSEAKPIIRQEMLAAGQAVTYSEPVCAG